MDSIRYLSLKSIFLTQSNFKDKSESLNIDNGLRDIQNIESENGIKPNFSLKREVFSNVIFL